MEKMGQKWLKITQDENLSLGKTQQVEDSINTGLEGWEGLFRWQ